MPVDIIALKEVIQEATNLAKQYRRLTGKPLGITGEVGEFLAAQLLGFELTDARQAGYDAIAGDGRRVQIKARCILPDSSPGQRVGGIKLDHEWDTVALILMNGDFEPIAVYEADRVDIERELLRPGSRARNERGALGITKFKSIGRLAWSREQD